MVQAHRISGRQSKTAWFSFIASNGGELPKSSHDCGGNYLKVPAESAMSHRSRT